MDSLDIFPPQVGRLPSSLPKKVEREGRAVTITGLPHIQESVGVREVARVTQTESYNPWQEGICEYADDPVNPCPRALNGDIFFGTCTRSVLVYCPEKDTRDQESVFDGGRK